MIYFGENTDYILCECEICKGEMYVEKSSVSEADAYAYHLYLPIKCQCGAIDEYINRAKKSCHIIKYELSDLSDLLHRQLNVSNKISDITAELNKKFVSPSFLQSIASDILFSLKVFLYLLGAVIGVELFLFIISSLMFFFGLAFQDPNLSNSGNELFYYINIFKERGGNFLSKFGWDATVKPLGEYGVPAEDLIFGYIPAAIAGIIIIVFYVFLIVLLLRAAISIAQLTFFASKVVNRKIKISQRKEEYRKQLNELSAVYQNLSDKIGEFTVIPADYKNIRATDAILRIFANNRADTIREAVNLFHEEDFRSRLLEYNRGVYNEAKQTRRYTKALYMLTSDENIKVDVKDIKEETNEAENIKVGEMLTDAFSKIKKPSKSSKSSRTAINSPESAKRTKTESLPSNLAPDNQIQTSEADKTDMTDKIDEILENTEENLSQTEDIENNDNNINDIDAEKIDLNEIFEDAQQTNKE